MNMLARTDHELLAHLSQRNTLPVVSTWAVKLAWIILVWTQRHRTRAQLRRLDDAMLADIGLSPDEAHEEFMKAFWRP